MKYNEKYGRWFTKGGLVYRYDSRQNKLVLCKQFNHYGYKRCGDSKYRLFYIHRGIYETFVGEIPSGYEIDHINTVRDDNRLENLRVVTHTENNRNPLTRKHHSEALKNKSYPHSEFGKKYIEHFGYSKRDNEKQYARELYWFKSHGKFSWEK